MQAASRRPAAAEAKVVKNRVHFDVYVRDVAALLALGAHVLAEYLLLGRVTLADVGAKIGLGRTARCGGCTARSGSRS